jgi:hypothetical protein
MKNIRKAVFETNSSSSHSIHIDNETALLDTSLLPNDDGVVILTGGEFGWAWERFNDAVTKANYCAVKESGVSLDLLKQAIMEQTGAKEVTYIGSGDWDAEKNSGPWAYIDHDSHGTAGDLFTVEMIKNFVFNPNCWLVTGNDNEYNPFNLFDFPKTNSDGTLEEVKYAYKLEIEGFSTSPKFKSRPKKKQVVEAIVHMTERSKFYEKGAEQSKEDFYGRKINRFEAATYYLEEYPVSHYDEAPSFEPNAWEFGLEGISVDMRRKTLKVYSSDKLGLLMREKFTHREEAELGWETARKIKMDLATANIDDISMDIPFKIVAI